MKIVFADFNHNVIQSLKWQFDFLHNPLVDFEYYVGDIFDVQNVDVYVSAGNSYAVLTGGIDFAFRQKFGMHVQDSLQHEIFFNRNQLYGCLNVGESITITLVTGQKLVYSPTMRVPSNVKDTQNAFLAFSSALLELRKIQSTLIKPITVACPGFCTLTGGMDPKQSAAQMMNAYRLSAWHNNSVWQPGRGL